MAIATRSTSPVVRWDPFADFDQIVRSLASAGWSGPARSGNRQQSWRPLADVTETQTGYEVQIEVPGLKRDDITVDITGDVLTVTGEYRDAEDGATRRSLRSGRFEYRTQLPKGTSPDDITAALSDGILTLTVPKTATAEPRRVEISAG